jgi:hypothetical protein
VNLVKCNKKLVKLIVYKIGEMLFYKKLVNLVKCNKKLVKLIMYKQLAQFYIRQRQETKHNIKISLGDCETGHIHTANT